MLLVMSTKRLTDGTRDQEDIIDEHRQHSLNKNNLNDVHLNILFIFQHLNMSYVILKCQPKSFIRFCNLQNVVKGRKDASLNNK